MLVLFLSIQVMFLELHSRTVLPFVAFGAD